MGWWGLVGAIFKAGGAVSHTEESFRDFLVRETGGRSVIEVLYPQAAVAVPCVRCEDEIGRMLCEIFGIWPSES